MLTRTAGLLSLLAIVLLAATASPASAGERAQPATGPICTENTDDVCRPNRYDLTWLQPGVLRLHALATTHTDGDSQYAVLTNLPTKPSGVDEMYLRVSHVSGQLAAPWKVVVCRSSGSGTSLCAQEAGYPIRVTPPDTLPLTYRADANVRVALKYDGPSGTVSGTNAAKGRVDLALQWILVDHHGPDFTVDVPFGGPDYNLADEPGRVHVAVDGIYDDTGSEAFGFYLSRPGFAEQFVPGSAQGGAVDLDEGDWTIRGHACDGYQNCTGVTESVRFDRTAPTASVQTPAVTRSSAPVISVQGTDPLGNGYASGLAEVGLDVNGYSAQPTSTGPGSATFQPELDDGVHDLLPWAVDALGNPSPETTTTLTVDATPPVVTIAAPDAGGTLAPGAAVRAGATDATSGIQQLHLFLDGRPRASVQADAVSYTPTPEELCGGGGKHVVKVVAVDVAGNERSAEHGFSAASGSCGSGGGSGPGSAGPGTAPDLTAPVRSAGRLRASTRLTPRGLGPIRIGMTLRVAARRAKVRFEKTRKAGGGCGYTRLTRGRMGLHFMIERGRIVRIETSTNERLRTTRGVHLGSSLSDLRRALSGLRVTRHANLPGASYAEWRASRSARFGLAFEVDSEGVVRSLRGGRLSAVRRADGCA